MPRRHLRFTRMDQLIVSGLKLRHSRDHLISQHFSDTFFGRGAKSHNAVRAVELQALHLRPV